MTWLCCPAEATSSGKHDNLLQNDWYFTSAEMVESVSVWSSNFGLRVWYLHEIDVFLGGGRNEEDIFPGELWESVLFSPAVSPESIETVNMMLMLQ